MTRPRNIWFVPDRAHLPGTICRFRGYGEDFLVFIDGIATLTHAEGGLAYICTPLMDGVTGANPGREWLRTGYYPYKSFPALESMLEPVL